MISAFSPLASPASLQAVKKAEKPSSVEGYEPMYPGLYFRLRVLYAHGGSGDQKLVNVINDIAMPAEQVLASRKILYEFFDTPKWLWNPGLPGCGDTVVVRVHDENRSILLSVQPLTEHDCTVAKMIELGDNNFRMKALKVFKEYLPTIKKPEPDIDALLWRKGMVRPLTDSSSKKPTSDTDYLVWRKPTVQPVPDGTISVEMLFNDVPMTIKGSRIADLCVGKPQKEQTVLYAPIVSSDPRPRAAAPASPSREGPPSTVRGIERSVPASAMPVLPSPSRPWAPVEPAPQGPPQDPRKHPRVGSAPIILAMAAGGLLASTMIGAGLLSAPAPRTALTIMCSATMGVWVGYLTFGETNGAI